MKRAQLIALYRMYDPEAKFWSLAELRELVAAEHPEWLAEPVEMSAIGVFRALCRLDAAWYNSQRKGDRHLKFCRNPLCPQATTAEEEDAFMGR